VLLSEPPVISMTEIATVAVVLVTPAPVPVGHPLLLAPVSSAAADVPRAGGDAPAELDETYPVNANAVIRQSVMGAAATRLFHVDLNCLSCLILFPSLWEHGARTDMGGLNG
jgi:hypothetical protein